MSTTKNTETPKTIFPNWKIFTGNYLFIFLGIITIAGLILRFYRLDFLSLWVDEYMHVTPANTFLKGGSILHFDNNGLFLTWVVVAFFKLFGITDVSARIPSVIFGTLSIPLIYYLAKNLFNKSIGAISAILGAFSFYAIIWSRIARNYASFEFSFLILLIVIWLMLNARKNANEAKNTFFTRNNIDKKYLILFPIVFIFSFLNHQLTFFSIFGLGVYIVYLAIQKIIRKEERPFTNLYAILSYLVIFGGIMLFTPKLLDLVAKPILSILLPEKIIAWVLPDWAYIGKLFKSSETRFDCFMVYFNIIKNDYTLLYYLGIFGFVAAFFNSKKKNGAAFLGIMFLVPFLLMSFIFRTPCTPNYLFFIYPLFLISIASTIYFIVYRLVPLVLPQSLLDKKWMNGFFLILIFIGIFLGTPKEDIKSLITTRKHGQVANKALIHVGYVNWKGICKVMKRYVKKDDIVISTWTGATDWYLKRNNSIWFRQRYYDTQAKEYKYRKPSGIPNTAQSYEDLTATFYSNKKGWLFADYYFNNVMTDPKAREFVIQNMDFNFNLSNGDVQIFSWNHDTPKKQYNSLIIELGKNENKTASKEMSFNISDFGTLNKLVIYIEAEGIDKANEAFLSINNKNNTPFKAKEVQKGGVFNYIDPGRQVYVFSIQKSWLIDGKNSIRFYYNNQVKNKPLGFVIYNVSFQNQ